MCFLVLIVLLWIPWTHNYTYIIESSVNEDSFTAIHLCNPFICLSIYSSRLIVLAKVPKKMLNGSGESRHSCFEFNLRGKLLYFSQWHIM